MPSLSRRALLAGLATAGVSGAAFQPRQATGSYEDPRAFYQALTGRPDERIMLDGGTISVVFAGGAPGLDRAMVCDWVRLAASAVATYFGRFPVASYGLLVIAGAGGQIGHATTYGFAGSATRIQVGRNADRAAFRDDWVLVHEMMHAALPDLPRHALWLQEGNATWLEPIARAQAGSLPVSEVWTQALRGMPRGVPDDGERGMDGTDRWGRLYWGGATFWLEAEIAIWEQSGGAKGLIDAMRAVAAASGGNSVTWSPEQLMVNGDTACGVTALMPLYRCYADERVTPDLARLFGRLGVRWAPDGRLVLDPHAELASLRTRITQRQPEATRPRPRIDM
jgi:hypothetical protein